MVRSSAGWTLSLMQSSSNIMTTTEGGVATRCRHRDEVLGRCWEELWACCVGPQIAAIRQTVRVLNPQECCGAELCHLHLGNMSTTRPSFSQHVLLARNLQQAALCPCSSCRTAREARPVPCVAPHDAFVQANQKAPVTAPA